MATENLWTDPRTWVSIGSLCVGIGGLFYARWNRRESRLDALSKILQPLVKSAQQLHEANGSRRRCELLKFSFAQAPEGSEAVSQIKMLVAEYGEHLKASRDEFRLAESEFASRAFRFPDNVTGLVQKAIQSLSEFGRLVNNGAFDKADLQFARFHDDYRQIVKKGRGWRLADPLEGLLRHFRRKTRVEETENKYDFSCKTMERIMELVHKRATSQAGNTFAVHPPRKLIDRPEIARADNVIEELDDSVFVVAFQDGTAEMMTLVELMVFTYNLLALAYQAGEVARMMEVVQPGDRNVSVSFRLSVDEIMRPAMVQQLLSKIEFSGEASDDAPVKKSA